MVWESNVRRTACARGRRRATSTIGSRTTMPSRRSPDGGRRGDAARPRRQRAGHGRAGHERISSRSSAARRSSAGPSRATSTSARPSIASGRTGGQEPILVLSHRLWQSLGADPALVGGTVLVEGRNWRVLGVMPADFAVPDVDAGFWTPWDMREAYRGARFTDGPPREARFLRAVGRLKPGLSREAAAGRMEILAARIAADHPRTNADWSVAAGAAERRAGHARAAPSCCSCSARCSVCSCSSAPTWRASRSRAARRGRERWRFAWRSAPAGRASSGSIWRRPRCARC